MKIKHTNIKITLISLTTFLFSMLFFVPLSNVKADEQTNPEIYVQHQKDAGGNLQTVFTVTLPYNATGTLVLTLDNGNWQGNDETWAFNFYGINCDVNRTLNNIDVQQLICYFTDVKIFTIILVPMNGGTSNQYPFSHINNANYNYKQVDNNNNLSSTNKHLQNIENYMKLIAVSGEDILATDTDIIYTKNNATIKLNANTPTNYNNTIISQIGSNFIIENGNIKCLKDGKVEIIGKPYTWNPANTTTTLITSVYKNNEQIMYSGSRDTGSQFITGYVMALIDVNENDVLNVKVTSSSSGSELYDWSTILCSYINEDTNESETQNLSKLDQIIYNQLSIQNTLDINMQLLLESLKGTPDTTESIDNNNVINKQLTNVINNYEQNENILIDKNTESQQQFNNTLNLWTDGTLTNLINKGQWYKIQVENAYNSLGNYKIYYTIPLLIGLLLILIGV